jgi:DnaJ-class molecular chaperone
MLCPDCKGKGMVSDEEFPLASRMCVYCQGKGEVDTRPVSIESVSGTGPETRERHVSNWVITFVVVSVLVVILAFVLVWHWRG